MTGQIGQIRKSFMLESEPVLRWPRGPATLFGVENCRLEYRGTGMHVRPRYLGTGDDVIPEMDGRGMEYTLYSEKGSSVVFVGWAMEQPLTDRRDLFSDTSLSPSRLNALAKLEKDVTAESVRAWVTKNGLLGFRPTTDSIVGERTYRPPLYVIPGEVSLYRYEPVECILIAARRAANVMVLWDALKKSYSGDGKGLRSIISIREDIADSEKLGSSPTRYRTLVNGEDRSRWRLPTSQSDWRWLANQLLGDYIQEHILGQVDVQIAIKTQNKDSEEGSVEPPPEWNLKPIWRVRSALAAYYVELLMVMRRFRSCKVCGKDISHQKANSSFCGDTCRSTDWYRRN